ncbi:hypothetical protein B296_00034676 [Ensete ventricosum]|uniref:Uncharacterized protein n=1 Tax=Ensete ventricosum TaxID=4639 RepID=A0A426XFI7_ENSVE|nr:hypothetical protein B296_00034676 [Ensete ventricosum]
MKKCDDHKLYAKSRAKSSFDQFFTHRLENSKYCPFPMIIRPWEVVQAWFREKM